MKLDITAALQGLVVGICVMLLVGCGNKGDLELVRKPVAVNLPAPVSVPEDMTTAPEAPEVSVGSEGVVLDIPDVAAEKKKKQTVSE